MKIALTRWPEYAVERILLDVRITTLAFMNQPDYLGLPLHDDELNEPVSVAYIVS